MYITVNIEEGMPLADAAVKRAANAIQKAKRERVVAVKFIHGYGSTGSGGRIRIELRKYLSRQLTQGAISLFVPGEKLSIFDADTRTLLEACPQVRRDSDLERHNNGVTVVLL